MGRHTVVWEVSGAFCHRPSSGIYCGAGSWQRAEPRYARSDHSYPPIMVKGDAMQQARVTKIHTVESVITVSNIRGSSFWCDETVMMARHPKRTTTGF